MTVTETGVITPETYAEVVAYGWEVYRRTQQIPWPVAGGGEVMKAQSRLWHLVAPYATGTGSGVGADFAGIRRATGDLIAAVKRYCGDAYAEFASGQDGSVAA